MTKELIKNHLRPLIFRARPEVCPDVAVWAKAHGIPVQELHPPVVNEIEPFISDDPVARQEFETHYAVLVRPQSLVVIEKAVVRDSVGFVELPDGKVCYEGNWWMPYLQNHPVYQRRFLKKRRQLAGNVYSLLCLWSAEFYHWFHDVLPRLEMALPHLPRDIKFLINEKPKEWQLHSLQAYGISPSQLEIQPAGVHTTAGRLWFATPVGHASLGSGRLIRQVAGRLNRFWGITTAGCARRRIYISRRKAAMRRVVNEVEVEPILKEQGFEIVMCEELSLREQAGLFAEANVICGPHGAGLTNMIYAQNKRVQIWELTASRQTVPCYLVLSRQLGCEFRRPGGVEPADGMEGDMFWRGKAADFKVLNERL